MLAYNHGYNKAFKKCKLLFNEKRNKRLNDIKKFVMDKYVSNTELTNKRDILNCKHGLYKIYWKSGGSSLASIGSLSCGARWFAPTNWTNARHPTGVLENYVDDIIKLKLISK